jgi:Family of unknown function (DUF6338)
MPDKIEGLGIFLVLLPGFTCAYFAQYLAVRRKQTDLERVIEALLFSVILYLLTLPFFGYNLPVTWHEVPSHSGSFQLELAWTQLVVLAVSSLVLGVAYAANINHDWLMRLFRWMGVTDRTARSSIWNDVFQEIRQSFVQVGLPGDIQVVGWLRYYSDEAKDSSLFLEDAAWYDKDGTEHVIDGPGILLTRRVGIQYVLFLDEPEVPIEED